MAKADCGACVCRVITEGPDEDADKLLFVILGAIAVAHRQVLIMTPYFIPPPELTAALQTAALRGVEVCLVLPARSNLRYVDWATRRWLPLTWSNCARTSRPARRTGWPRMR